MSLGYAVLDFETTGLVPENSDRVIEIAVVHVAPNGDVEGSWETLVNPGRDLGPQRIHHIRTSEVLHAPTFDQLGSSFVALLTGRVLVAHNSSFEARFLRAELKRIGALSPVENAMALCTMKLAGIFLPGAGRSLADCCAAYDIDLLDAHEALGDARATAQLLGAYLSQHLGHPFWNKYNGYASAHVWPDLRVDDTPWLTRVRDNQVQRTFLARTTSLLSDMDIESVEHDTGREYLSMVDRALADGYLSVDEADALHAFSLELGMSGSDRAALHLRYFDDLVRVVWFDGELTPEESVDVRAVGTLLDIPVDHIAAALVSRGPRISAGVAVVASAGPTVTLHVGDLVVLTGEMAKPRPHYEAALEQRGLKPMGALTKRVSLLIAADADTLSGKARKARQYGVPIRDEAWLIAYLDSVPS